MRVPQGVSVARYCRVCNSDDILPSVVLDLGTLDLVSFPRTPQAVPHPPVPVMVQRCPTCTLVQLRHACPSDWLYKEYWYRSGTNETMVQELHSIVEDARARLGDRGVKASTVVLDIGANDGTLLQAWGDTAEDLKQRPYRVAFEPATTFYQDLRRRTEELHAVPFPDPSAPMAAFTGRVAAITTIAMVYDLAEPHGFVGEVARLLAPKGVWIAQFQDLLSVMSGTQVDYFCHEHLECYSLASFAQLVAKHGLQVVDVEPRQINGGSLRVVVRHAGREWDSAGLQRVQAQIQRESDAGLLTADPEKALQPWERFSARVNTMVQQVRAIIDQAYDQGLTVDLLGASTKGVVLLQLCGLTAVEIRQAWERSGAKFGRYIAGTGIPIVSEMAGRMNPPDVLIVPIWQFRDAVIQREIEYLVKGGSMVFPLPAPAEVYRMAAAGVA
jgi:NDP-4-keto-2,6-dideoxyhexose 3-C-methyltransferase